MFYSHLHFEEQKSTGLLDIAKKKYKGMYYVRLLGAKYVECR
jgi:hypothetical protein